MYMLICETVDCFVDCALIGNRQLGFGNKMSQPEKTIRRDPCVGNRGISRRSDYLDFCSSLFETVFKVKVVLVGDSGAGKTCLATRFVKGSFTSEDTASLGAAFLHKEVEMKDHTILFQIWDTAGQERYRSLVPMYLRGAKAALLVYDTANLDSFITASEWLKQLHLHCHEDIKIVLVAAKCDLPSAVPPATAQEFATKNQMLFMETSSKTGVNVDKVFTTLASLIMVMEEKDETGVLDLTKSDLKKKRCCSS